MKLLIFTQKVDRNDSVLGFFHKWIEEFAENCERVTVICLQKGDYSLPDNVRVLSLGKEGGTSKLKFLFNFYRFIWRERDNYDRVFVHMNPEYVILGGLFWKMLGRKSGLWYVHRQINLKLTVASLLCDVIFSTSPQGFRLASKKALFLGHGIDIEKFKCEVKKEKGDIFKIISVGRITKIKNLDILIEAISILKKKYAFNVEAKIIGEPVVTQDYDYLRRLRRIVDQEGLGDSVIFSGPIDYQKIVREYCLCDLTVNLCPTGGVDKAVLESMACGIPIVLTNESFRPYLGNFAENFIVPYQDPQALADRIYSLKKLGIGREVSEFLRGQIIKQHTIEALVKKIVSNLSR